MSNRTPQTPSIKSYSNQKHIVRDVLIAAAYICAFIVLDLFTLKINKLQGVMVWYPPVGLTYALLIVLGVRYMPVVAIALLIDSLLVFRYPLAISTQLLWALSASSIYSFAASFLRRRTQSPWQLRKLQEVIWFISATGLASALLAIISVSSSALSGDISTTEIFYAIILWWIGEMVGVLTVTPILLMYGIPWQKKLAAGQPITSSTHHSSLRLRLLIIGQVLSVAFILYWVFAAEQFLGFQSPYLLILPLVWIVVTHGSKGFAIGILIINFGVALSLLFFRFDLIQLSEFGLVMLISCIIGFTIGAVISDRKEIRQKSEEQNQELLFQNDEKEKRAAELVIANHELIFQNEEKEKRAAELVIANQELLFQNEEKEKRAAELVIANHELIFQNEEKEKRAAERVIANQELLFQNEEKEKRAAELVIANQELLFQNEEKEKRAAELVVANKELVFQNGEKEKRAAELVIANQELVFQNDEKEKRAAELVVANKELVFQNEEKEKRAAELVIANEELIFQNEEKEKRAAELIIANEEIEHSLKNIQAMHKIDNAIKGSLDLALTLSVVVEQVKTQLNIDAVVVLLLNKHTHILKFASGIGFRNKNVERAQLRVGEGYGGRVVLEEKMICIPNLLEVDTSFIRAPLLADEGFVSFFGSPLFVKGQIIGVLEVFNRSPFTPDENWLEFFKILAGQVAIAVDSSNLFTELKQSNEHLFAAYDSTLEGWSRALDLRDKETEGHTIRVMEMTVKLGYAAGIDGEKLLQMRRGALLHDIGKIGIPDNILLKPGSLTDEEWVVMRKHPVIAFELLSPIAYLHPAMDIPYCHHEKWDGSGYPRGLKGEQIPLTARLFAVVDVWDALCSNRPYRQGWPQEKVLEHILSLAGTHFAPKAVELFLEEVDKDTKATA